jgi:hypothetical protein
VQDLPGIFAGDDSLATAILDRLSNKSVALNLQRPSYRVQNLKRHITLALCVAP